MSSGDHEANHKTGVIIRLVRNCALERMIQYSRDAGETLMSRGVLGAPPSWGTTVIVWLGPAYAAFIR
jgi:hypothetical protein